MPHPSTRFILTIDYQPAELLPNTASIESHLSECGWQATVDEAEFGHYTVCFTDEYPEDDPAQTKLLDDLYSAFAAAAGADWHTFQVNIQH